MKPISIIKLLMVSMVLLLIHSCDNGVLPNPDDNKVDRLKWTYDFPTVMAFSLYNTVPAIDEDGNIYVVADVQSGGLIVKLSPSGDEVWAITERDFPLSRLIYSKGKLFYINNGKLICLNSSDGSENWNAEASGSQEIFALNSGKIYTTNFVDIGLFGQTHLNAYDNSGNKLWETQITYSDTDTICFGSTIGVVNNNIYVGIFTEVGSSNFAIINYVDNGNSVTKQWTWLAPEHFSVGGGSPRIKDLAFDENNNLIEVYI